MKRHIKSKSQLLIMILIVGFFLGILYGNWGLKETLVETTIFQRQVLKEFGEMEIVTEHYLFYVIKARIFLLFLFSLIGIMRFRKTISSCLLWSIGFLHGTMAMVALKELGGSGILVYIAGNLPQAIFYTISLGFILQQWFAEPRRQWNVVKIVFIILMYTLGIITETYVNPLLVKMIVNLI